MSALTRFQGFQPEIIVPNLAGVHALIDRRLSDGTVAFALSVQRPYRLDKTSTATADGITVLETFNGIGRWVAVHIPQPKWTAQQTWRINADTGDDEGDGTTTPLRTAAELKRRYGVHGTMAPGGITDVLIETDLPDDDPIDLRVEQLRDVVFQVSGLVREVADSAGVIMDVVAKDRAENQPWEITGSTDLGAYVGSYLRLTSGTYEGYRIPIAKDLGSNTVRVGETGTVYPPEFFSALVLGEPSIDDTYVIDELPTVTYGRVDSGLVAYNDQSFMLTFLQFRHLRFRASNPFFSNVNVTNQNTLFAECQFDATLFVGCNAGFLIVHNCIFGPTSGLHQNGPALSAVSAGLFLECGVAAEGAANPVLDADVLFQGGGGQTAPQIFALAGTNSFIGYVGVFDSTTDAAFVEAGGTFKVRTTPLGFGGQAFWGTGAAGVALHLEKGAVGTYEDADELTATGDLGEFSLGPVTSEGLLVRPFDNSDATFGDAIATEWANLETAAPDGFGDNAINHVNGAALVKRG
jgi:hypothetical protein